MQLDILCTSPVSEGMDPADAVQNTVALADLAESSGYHRFWVAEHHSDVALACASPGILATHIAARTERIRIATGGVLLPYTSPLKVAEDYKMLAALNPGRIDLGVGRGGGTEGHAAQALGRRSADFSQFDALLHWLADDDQREWADTFASPRSEAKPAPWVLGTSPSSAEYAGSRGLPYIFGGFLDPRPLIPSLAAYHQAFRPSRWSERPHVNLAWYVQAAETEAEAKALTKASSHWFVEALLRMNNIPFPSPQTVAAARYSPVEHGAIAMREQFALVGTGAQVLEGLETLQKQLAVDAFTLVTLPFEPEARFESYRLIAEANGA